MCQSCSNLADTLANDSLFVLLNSCFLQLTTQWAALNHSAFLAVGTVVEKRNVMWAYPIEVKNDIQECSTSWCQGTKEIFDCQLRFVDVDTRSLNLFHGLSIQKTFLGWPCSGRVSRDFHHCSQANGKLPHQWQLARDQSKVQTKSANWFGFVAKKEAATQSNMCSCHRAQHCRLQTIIYAYVLLQTLQAMKT